MSWAEVRKRVHERILKDRIGRAFGIPKGGSVVAALLPADCVADSPEEADYFVDDIIDSGRTASRWVDKYHRVIVALVNKQYNAEDRALGWVHFPWEADNTLPGGAEDSVVRLLEWIGEDPSRNGLLETPARVTRSFREMTEGYRMDPGKILERTFDITYDEMVVLRGIRFTSLCEHHLLPFIGEATVAYVPAQKVVGISKLARLVQCYAKRLQVQERMTNEIATAIQVNLNPVGVGVVIRAHHACMGCRGALQPETEMVTSRLLGCIRDRPEARAELLGLMR